MNNTLKTTLCINTRNGIELVRLSDVLFLHADGNYTEFVTTDGKKRIYLSNLSKYDEYIDKVYERLHLTNPFFRLTRSYLVNTDYVQSVNLNTQMLSFFSDTIKPMKLSKKLLKALQDFLYERFGGVRITEDGQIVL